MVRTYWLGGVVPPVVPDVEPVPVVGSSVIVPLVPVVPVPVVPVVPIAPVLPVPVVPVSPGAMVPVVSPVVPIVSVAGISVVVFVVSSAAVSAGSLEQPATRASGAAANQSKIFIAILQEGDSANLALQNLFQQQRTSDPERAAKLTFIEMR